MDKDFVRVEGVAALIGLSVGRTYHVTALEGFPPPRERIGNVKLWHRDDIINWNETRPKRRKHN